MCTTLRYSCRGDGKLERKKVGQKEGAAGAGCSVGWAEPNNYVLIAIELRSAANTMISQASKAPDVAP